MFIAGKIIFVLSLINYCLGGHYHTVQNDVRGYILLSSYGYNDGGQINIRIVDFEVSPENNSTVLGLSMHQSTYSRIGPSFDRGGITNTECTLEHTLDPVNKDVTYFNFDLKYGVVYVRCNMEKMRQVYASKENIPASFLMPRKHRVQRDDTSNRCGRSIPLDSKVVDGRKLYNTSFVMFFYGQQEEGYYKLYFHNCANYNADKKVAVNFTVDIREENRHTYLSAGQIPLPTFYFIMSVPYLVSGLAWAYHISRSKHPVFKIHNLLTLVMCLETILFLLTGIEYHYISRIAVTPNALDVFCDMLRLGKDMTVFTTLVLISSGWTFVKRALSFRDKVVMTVVIASRAMVYITNMVFARTDHLGHELDMWAHVKFFFDTLSWLTVITNVGLSMHCSPTSQTNAKSSLNFRKLFKHFIIILICYMYTAKVMVGIMELTVPYRYTWVNSSTYAIVNYVFYVLVLYKFRPVALNSYLALINVDQGNRRVRL